MDVCLCECVNRIWYVKTLLESSPPKKKTFANKFVSASRVINATMNSHKNI